jgi:hypothetical protein
MSRISKKLFVRETKDDDYRGEKMAKENANDKMKKWTEYFNELPWLKCNYCGVVFKEEHDCDYKRLKEKVIHYEKVLKEIAEETGTPYAKIAKEALEGFQ